MQPEKPTKPNRPSANPIRVIPVDRIAEATRIAYAHSQRDGMILDTLCETAIRNQELRLLQVSDAWVAGDVPNSLVIRAEIAKGGRRRTIPMTNSFRAKLRAYVPQVLDAANAQDNDLPLYPSTRGGGHLTRRGLCRVVAKHFRAAGYPATPHMLRHTAATELMRVCNARVVQLVLGHRRLDTVQIYTHPTDGDLREAMERRAAANRPKPHQP